MKDTLIEKLREMRDHDDALNPSDVAGAIAAIGTANFPETVQRLAEHAMALAERENTDFAEFNAALDKVLRAADARIGEMSRAAV